jgi:hypothetical protein
MHQGSGLLGHQIDPVLRKAYRMSILSNSRLASLFVAGVLLLAASGCSEQTESPARRQYWYADPTLAEAKLARRTFTLGETSFAIDLPEAAVVEKEFVDHSTGRREVTIDLTRGKRLRQFALSTIRRKKGPSYDQRDALANGARLEYHIEETEGGMGGPHAELNGRMEIRSHVLWIDCWDQTTQRRYPGWCVPFLARLEIVERP